MSVSDTHGVSLNQNEPASVLGLNTSSNKRLLDTDSSSEESNAKRLHLSGPSYEAPPFLHPKEPQSQSLSLPHPFGGAQSPAHSSVLGSGVLSSQPFHNMNTLIDNNNPSSAMMSQGMPDGGMGLLPPHQQYLRSGGPLSNTPPVIAAPLNNPYNVCGNSKTVIFKGLHHSITEADLISLLFPFTTQGFIPKIYLQSSLAQAVVELESKFSASQAVQYITTHTPQVRGYQVSVELSPDFSFHSDLNSESLLEEGGEGFRVILASVTNIVFPVDIELMHRLFAVYGTIEKIVTFSKTSTRYQALIQFSEARQAKEAMFALNNKCIYDGCNTLQIQSSKLQELVVKANNGRAWDYLSAPPPPKSDHQGGILSPSSSQYGMSAGGLLPNRGPGGGYRMGGSNPYDPPHVMQDGSNHRSVSDFQHSSMVRSHSTTRGSNGMNSPPHRHHESVHMDQSSQYNGQQPTSLLSMYYDRLPRELHSINIAQSNPTNTPVVICYNLPPKEITVPKLFNLFSLFGVVSRIKLLRDKPDTALIQFSDPLYATIACHYLQGISFFGSETGLQIGLSKMQEVKMLPPSSNPNKPATTDDSKRTVAFSSKDQRYGVDEVDRYIRGSCRPTNTLFIANLNDKVTEEDIRKLLVDYGGATRVEVKPMKEGAKKATAMAEMQSERDALTALCHLHNHRLLESQMKIAFSKQIMGRQGGGGQYLRKSEQTTDTTTTGEASTEGGQ